MFFESCQVKVGKAKQSKSKAKQQLSSSSGEWMFLVRLLDLRWFFGWFPPHYSGGFDVQPTTVGKWKLISFVYLFVSLLELSYHVSRSHRSSSGRYVLFVKTKTRRTATRSTTTTRKSSTPSTRSSSYSSSSSTSSTLGLLVMSAGATAALGAVALDSVGAAALQRQARERESMVSNKVGVLPIIISMGVATRMKLPRVVDDPRTPTVWAWLTFYQWCSCTSSGCYYCLKMLLQQPNGRGLNKRSQV